MAATHNTKNTNTTREHNLATVNVAQLKEHILIGAALGQVTYIEGIPGSGKTEIVRQTALDNGAVAVDFILSEMLPEDLGGFVTPDIAGRTAVRLMPDIVARVLAARQAHGKPVYAFFDELTNASNSVTASAFKILHERHAGGFPLPEDTVCIAAGNPTDVSSVAQELPAPLINRMSTVVFNGPTNDEWLGHMFARGVHPVVAGFLKFNPQYLCKEGDFNSGLPTPTPRSWTATSDMLNYLDKLGPVNPGTRLSAIASRVGSNAALLMETSLKYNDSLVPWHIIKTNPETAPVTQDFAPAYMQAVTLVSAIERNSPEEARIATTYARRLPREVLAVFALGISKRPDAGVMMRALGTDDFKGLVEMSASNNKLALKKKD
jgi:hypothetical protein